MTPKEKAKELVNIYKEITTTWILKDTITTSVINYDLAKQCALIVANEIIEELLSGIDFWMERRIKYWQEVKQEIELL